MEARTGSRTHPDRTPELSAQEERGSARGDSAGGKVASGGGPESRRARRPIVLASTPAVADGGVRAAPIEVRPG